jgi:hypothetical protein
MKDSPNMSRKEKIDVFEIKMNEIDDIIPEVEGNVDMLTEEMACMKLDFQRQLDRLRGDKLDRSEVKSILPTQASVDHNILKLCGREIDALNETLRKQLEKWDDKMIELRKEFDIGKLEKELKNKAS